MDYVRLTTNLRRYISMTVKIDFYDDFYYYLLKNLASLNFKVVSVTNYNDYEYLDEASEEYSQVILLNNDKIDNKKAVNKAIRYLKRGIKVVSFFNYTKLESDRLKKISNELFINRSFNVDYGSQHLRICKRISARCRYSRRYGTRLRPR